MLLSAAVLGGRRLVREEDEDGDDRELPRDELDEDRLRLIPRPTPGAKYPSVGGRGNVKDTSRDGGVTVICGAGGAGAGLLGPASLLGPATGAGANDAPRGANRMAERVILREVAEDEDEEAAGDCWGSRPSRRRRVDRSSSDASPSESCARFR